MCPSNLKPWERSFKDNVKENVRTPRYKSWGRGTGDVRVSSPTALTTYLIFFFKFQFPALC